MGAISTTINRVAIFGFVESRGLKNMPGASRRPSSSKDWARSYKLSNELL